MSVAQPPERDLLELGGRGRRAPQHRLLVERGGQKLREDARLARGNGEVAEEARVVPVGQRRDEHPLEVREDGVERLAMFGGFSGQRPADVAGRHAGQNRVALRPREVFSDPVDERVAVPPEVGGIHGLLVALDVIRGERLQRRIVQSDRLALR